MCCDFWNFWVDVDVVYCDVMCVRFYVCVMSVLFVLFVVVCVVFGVVKCVVC